MGTGNFFEQMADLAIYNLQGKDHYSVLARDPSNENKIKLMDIWKNGKYMFGNTIYPTNRLMVSNDNRTIKPFTVRILMQLLKPGSQGKSP